MIDTAELSGHLGRLGLDDWCDELVPAIAARLSGAAHGDFDEWRAALAELPDAATDPSRLRQVLMRLAPWRKGPFELGDVTIDAEWRSDLKWARLAEALGALDGQHVLDVGCGNGYYAFRMREAGAQSVTGIDPTLLYVMQFLAINTLRKDDAIFVLPFRLEELPGHATVFDTAFSMGVLYHQRSPLDHLRQLRGMLKPGGRLVLETLVLPGDDAFARTPADRYARMRNVWLLPTIAELETWLARSKFRDAHRVDVSRTAPAEQRRTEWMPFDSLAEALDPDDPSRTVEGWPAPMRAILTGTAP